MVSLAMRLLRAAVASSTLLLSSQAGYAPKDAPRLPEGFCPMGTGTVTDTTGGEFERGRSSFPRVDLNRLL